MPEHVPWASLFSLKTLQPAFSQYFNIKSKKLYERRTMISKYETKINLGTKVRDAGMLHTVAIVNDEMSLKDFAIDFMTNDKKLLLIE